MRQNLIKSFNATLVLAVLYSVGVIGLISPLRELVASLSPVILLLSCGLLLWKFKGWSTTMVLVYSLVFVVGYAVELIGINYPSFFGGTYCYGENLGLKLFEVPLLMGGNWLMLVICSSKITSNWEVPIVLKAVMAATLMVSLDFFLEPVAERLDFWHWEKAYVPLQNYLVWWLISFFLHLIVLSTHSDVKNKLAIPLYIILYLFFLILYFVVEI